MIVVGSDHGGVELKKDITKYLKTENIEYTDIGTFSEESCDYPDIAKEACAMVLNGQCDKAILICGTGIGMSITANRFNGIRAALCHDTFSAKATREHNDSNVLTMGQRIIGSGLAIEIVKLFLETQFSKDERHIRRIGKIN